MDYQHLTDKDLERRAANIFSPTHFGRRLAFSLLQGSLAVLGLSLKTPNPIIWWGMLAMAFLSALISALSWYHGALLREYLTRRGIEVPISDGRAIALPRFLHIAVIAMMVVVLLVVAITAYPLISAFSQ